MNIINGILQSIVAILIVLGIVILFSAKSLRPMLLAGAKVAWQRKYLWFVGIFAGLAAYGGEVNFLAQKIYDVGGFSELIKAIRDAVVSGAAHDLLVLLRQGFSTAPGLLSSYILLLLLLVAVIYWLIIISQGVVTRIAGRVAMGQTASFLDGITTASRKFWDMVKMLIIFLLIGWAAWLVLAGVPTLIFFITEVSFWSRAAEIGSYGWLVVSFVNLFLIQYSSAAIILNDKNAIDSIVTAWSIFRRNVLITFELGLALFAANLIMVILVASLLTFIFPLPSVGGLITTLVVLLLELGLLSAFSYAATVHLFVKLQKSSPESKLSEWTERIVNLATAKKAA